MIGFRIIVSSVVGKNIPSRGGIFEFVIARGHLTAFAKFDGNNQPRYICGIRTLHA